MSDNGASQEGGGSGTLNTETFRNLTQMSVAEMLKQYDEIGGPSTDPHYPKGWGMAGNTPFKRWKRDTHRGGNSDPLVVRWPRRIKDKMAIRNQYHHLVDIYPTLLELIGLPVPRRVNGIEQMPLEGISMSATLFDGTAPRVRQVQHYEMLGSRAIWNDGWSAVTWHSQGTPWEQEIWELYHTDEDFTQAHNLAGQFPEKLEKLKGLWWQLARQHQVLPLDDRGRERMVDPARPQAFEPRDVYRYYPGTSPVPSNCRPQLLNRSHRIRTEFEFRKDLTRGVLCGVGSAVSGWALFIKDNRLHYVHNALKQHYSVLRTREALPEGRLAIEFAFEALDRGVGRASLIVNGQLACDPAEVRTAPLMTSPMHEGLMIGKLWGSSPAWRDCESPFEFTGQFSHIELSMEAPLKLAPIKGRAES